MYMQANAYGIIWAIVLEMNLLWGKEIFNTARIGGSVDIYTI